MKRIGIVAIVAMVGLFSAACGDDSSDGNSANSAGDRATTIAGLTGDGAAGADVYETVCKTCHGDDGTGIDGLGNDLTTSTFTKDQTIDIVLNGGGDMTGYPNLSDKEIADVSAYSLSLQN